jgi:hypothetical protein
MSHSISQRISGPRRVRHDVRDSITVMAFSAVASCGVAVLLALAVRFGN